jgi:hypothetical protein
MEQVNFSIKHEYKEDAPLKTGKNQVDYFLYNQFQPQPTFGLA